MMATDVRRATNEFNDDVHQYWGSLGDSIMSLYWSITGGADWADLIAPLVDETGNQTHNILFSMYIAFSVMVIMNLVTGVFVEGAQRLSKEDKDRELVRMAYHTFNMVDDDGSADVSADEFNANIANGSMDDYLLAIELSKEDAVDLFQLLDQDGGGSISVEEFVDGCLRLKGPSRQADVARCLVAVQELTHNCTETMNDITLNLKSCRRELRSTAVRCVRLEQQFANEIGSRSRSTSPSKPTSNRPLSGFVGFPHAPMMPNSFVMPSESPAILESINV